jgi:predicted DCC family thiol-disulfide oxidoreductase YuxK
MGPDGRCILCQRDVRALEKKLGARGDPARRIAIVVVALMAAIATFFLVGAVLDTR